MDAQVFITPGQIRAARALLNWSQDQLANTAQVSISSVRDIESERRAADSSVAQAIRVALDNGGIAFIRSDEAGGPGVRLASTRPLIVRRPTTITKWEGAPFDVEWRGQLTTVLVSREVLEDLESLHHPANEALLQSFEKHTGKILDAVARAISNPSNFDDRGLLHVRTKDIEW